MLGMKKWVAVLAIICATSTTAQAQKPGIWTGLYVGAHGGYGSTKWTGGDIDIDTKASGALGGVHAGYNYQSGQIVMGVEVDHSFSAMKKTFTDGADSVTLKTGGMTSMRGRLGFAASPSLLVYGTLGYGWTRIEGSATDGVDAVKFSDTSKGVVFGAGAEYRFMPNMTLRGEVLRYAADVKREGETLKTPVTAVRAGLSFHF